MNYVKFSAQFGLALMLIHGRETNAMQASDVVLQKESKKRLHSDITQEAIPPEQLVSLLREPSIFKTQAQSSRAQNFPELLTEIEYFLRFIIDHYGTIKQDMFEELLWKVIALNAVICEAQTNEASGSPIPLSLTNDELPSLLNNAYFRPIDPPSPLTLNIIDENQEATLHLEPILQVRGPSIPEARVQPVSSKTFRNVLTETRQLLCYFITHYGSLKPRMFEELLWKVTALNTIISRTRANEASGSPLPLSLPNPALQAPANNRYFRPITPPSPLSLDSEPLAYVPQHSPELPVLPTGVITQEELPEERVLPGYPGYSQDTSCIKRQEHKQSEPKPLDTCNDWKLNAKGINRKWDFIDRSNRKRATTPVPEEIKREVIKLLHSPAPDGKKWSTHLVNQELVSKQISVNPAQLANLIRSFKKAESNKRKRL